MTLSYERPDSFPDKRQGDRLVQRKSVSRLARVVLGEFRWHRFGVPWSNKQANVFLKSSKIHEPSFVPGTAVLIKRHAVADALRSTWRCVFNDAAKLNQRGRTSLGAAAIYESTSFGVFMLFLFNLRTYLAHPEIRYILFPKMRRTSKLLLRMDALQASLSIQDRHAFRRLMLLRLMNFVPGNG